MADYINKIRTTEGDKPVNYEALANKPNSLPNPNKIKFTGSVVAEYDGSSEVTVNIPNGASEEQAAQIQTNTNDISELKNKTSELKGDLDYLNDDINDIINNNKEKVNEISFVFVERTENGLTLKQNEDGTISLTGTATTSHDFPLTNSIYGLGNKTVIFYGEAESVYLYENNVGAIRINDSLGYFKNGNTFVIPDATSYKLVIWIEKDKTYNQTISFKLYEGNNVSRNKNDIADYNNKLDTNLNNINKSLSCEDLISESDNLLTDSIFNNAVDGLTKNGIEFNFKNAFVDTYLTNIFNEFTLEKGEYSLLIASENKLSNALYFTIQDENLTTSINIYLSGDTNLNAVHFTLKHSVTFVRCGFFGYVTSYHLTGKIRLALVKGNADKFSYKINEEINLINTNVNLLKNKIDSVNDCLFYDDFTTEKLDETKWVIRVNGENYDTINNELQIYTKDNVYLENGNLVLHAHRVTPGDNTQWTSGKIDTEGLFAFGPYTRVECRAKFDNAIGGWPAIWSFGSRYHEFGVVSQWPNGGEIDIIEQVNKENTCHSSVHYPNGSGGIHSVTNNVACKTTDWHTYWCENDGNRITIGFDDTTVLSEPITTFTVNGYNPFIGEHCSQKVVLNLAVGGNFPGNPTDDTPDDFYAYFDYVKVIPLKKTSKMHYLEVTNKISEMNVGDEHKLLVLTDETVSDTTLIFVSTNEDVAKVSNNGIIKAISSGKCKIYIKSNGSAFERMDVVVN